MTKPTRTFIPIEKKTKILFRAYCKKKDTTYNESILSFLEGEKE